MSGDEPKTLLEHSARVIGKQGRVNQRPPEETRRFANEVLQSLGVVERKDVMAALQDSGNRAHHAAWLERHAVKVLDILRKASPESHAVLREVWTHAFEAGARDGSIRADRHYLRIVRAQSSRTSNSAVGRANSANKRRKITDAKLLAMQKSGHSLKGIAKEAGVSRQAIYKRLRSLKP